MVEKPQGGVGSRESGVGCVVWVYRRTAGVGQGGRREEGVPLGLGVGSVLKNELAALGYSLNTAEVQADIDTFEPLACQEHFANFDPEDEYPWKKIRSPIRLAIRKIWAELGL